MPAVPLAFRTVCGCFAFTFVAFMHRRFLFKTALFYRTLRLRKWQDGVTVGLLLSLFYHGILLQRCGDVELNPGPPAPPVPTLSGTKTTNLTQTKLRSGSASIGATSAASNASPARRTVEPTLTDVMSYLESKFDGVKGDMKEMKDMVTGLHDDVLSLKDEVVDLRRENNTLKEQNDRLSEKVLRLEQKTDDLECRSKRNNVIIHGIPRTENETREECAELVQDMITDKLEMTDDIQFDRLHRLNRKADSPIIGCCTFYKEKEKLLNARRKLQGTKVFIGEDFSQRVREIRRKLVPHLKAARGDGKKASMVYDHLVVEGKKFGLDSADQLILLK